MNRRDVLGHLPIHVLQKGDEFHLPFPLGRGGVDRACYEETRNAAQATIVWRFTTTKAREKLHRLYPSNSK